MAGLAARAVKVSVMAITPKLRASHAGERGCKINVSKTLNTGNLISPERVPLPSLLPGRVRCPRYGRLRPVLQNNHSHVNAKAAVA